MSDETKLTRTKRAWTAQGRFLTGAGEARPEDQRLPPGQHLVTDWPVLDLGTHPALPLKSFRLDVNGFAEAPLSLDWEAIQALPQARARSDIHCVTSWSRYDNDWRGVRVRDLLERARPMQIASHVLLHGADGYTTNLPLDDFASEGAMLATHWNGEPLSRAHGGPLRAVIPHLYFWKSAKWLTRIELIGTDRAGFWERNGYHMYGDPWREQRYG
ncbi:sulfite oxidase-like oxidoreductase [Pseudoroseicyclus aestuarii]|uniref:DMSO/TMAO reductase YedYZ molybdopterin-dependent catalytic subunit n=1 Tax=Pseudoroseicyclus aestuarii TaxID=1795041 RepID=A0A318SND1_9RHOB|nr:sulfite oxidase-like oxidoreductase [Pseudoroseicyclus aestuarii]PYE82323.1 DMSO/TMAO reductase YedYZ molybdopterin-dependent catalytic subunit [Pseudoroseicyclus aestuarii]